MRRISLFSLFALLLFSLPGQAACSGVRPAGSADVHVIDHYITDTVLHRKWAVMVDCSHPERPWTLEEVPMQRKVSTSLNASHLLSERSQSAPLVAAGATVQLWRVAPDGSIHLRGVALDSGEEGQTIHVRVQHSTTVLEGKIRGAGSVELLISDRWKSR